MYEAICHCGNVTLTAAEVPTSVTSCNCSLCSRLGAWWAYYLEPEVTIQVSGWPQAAYRWGKERLSFYHCEICGCTTHYTMVTDKGENRVAINSRMGPKEVISEIPVRYFDGADTRKYLETNNA